MSKNIKRNTSTVAEKAPEMERAGISTTEEKKSENEAILRADTFIGTYRTSTALNIREQPNAGARVVTILSIDTPVKCDGVYAMDGGIRYLHVDTEIGGERYEGFCQVRFLVKTA